MLDTLSRNLFDFDRPESPGERIAFQIVEIFVVAFAIQLCWEWAFEIQRIGAVVLPLGIAEYVDISFMFDNQISILNAAAVTVLCVLGFLRVPGWKFAKKWAYAGAILLFHLQYVSRYCLGEISHGSNFIGMSVLSLALASALFSVDVQRRRFALGSLYFFIGLGYTSAGVSKLVGTGIDWPDGRHLWMWMAERRIDMTSRLGEFDPNWIQQLILDDYRLGTVALTFGLLAELFGFLIWFRRTRYVIIPALIAMHIGVALTMNIRFDLYIYQLIILGIPWATLIDRIQNRPAGARLEAASPKA